MNSCLKTRGKKRKTKHRGNRRKELAKVRVEDNREKTVKPKGKFFENRF